MASPRISLHPATTSLVPTFAQISSLAFAKDTHTLLKTRSTGIDHAEDMAPALEMWLARPRERCQVITALIENENGKEVVGWACWAFRGFDGPVVEQEGNEDLEAEEEKVEQAVVLPPTDRGLEGEKTEKKEKPKGIQRLEDITNSSMMQWSSKLSPEGSKNMILCAITVHPSYQGKGVGKALINWGLEIADKEGVYCWVHASEAGWRVFERLGFAEVGRLEVDLDVYSSGVRNPLDEEGKWGQYMFRYMQREAINEK
ncbi:acetyltransferase [Halenospora varia]|nr:acetyltransferase [Halenospora varia]